MTSMKSGTSRVEKRSNAKPTRSSPRRNAVAIKFINEQLKGQVDSAKQARDKAQAENVELDLQLGRSSNAWRKWRDEWHASEAARTDERTPEDTENVVVAFKDLINRVERFVRDFITIPLLENASHLGTRLEEKTDTIFAKIFQAKIELNYDLGKLARSPGATESSILESMIWRILLKKVFLTTPQQLVDFYQTPEERANPPMMDRSMFQNAGRYVDLIDSIFFSMAANVDTEPKRFRALSLRSKVLDDLFMGNHRARVHVDRGRAEGIRHLTFELASRLDVFAVEQHVFLDALQSIIVEPAVHLMERFVRDQYDYQVNLDLFTKSDLDRRGEDAEIRFRKSLADGAMDFRRASSSKAGWNTMPAASRARVDKLCAWTPCLSLGNRPLLSPVPGVNVNVLVKQKMIVIGKNSRRTEVKATFMSRIARQRRKEGKLRVDFFATLVPHASRTKVGTCTEPGLSDSTTNFNSDDSMVSDSSLSHETEEAEAMSTDTID